MATPISRKWGRQLLADFVGASYEAALGTLLDSTTESEVHRLPLLVSKLKQPVYFISGAKDQVMATKYVKHLASFHWMFKGHGGNVLEVPECGHLAMLEKPDALSGYIQSFLQ